MEIQNYLYDLPEDLQQKIFKYVYDGCMMQLKTSNIFKLYTLYKTIKYNKRHIDYWMYEFSGGRMYKRLSLKDYTTDNIELTEIKYIRFRMPILKYNKAVRDKIKTEIQDDIELSAYMLCITVYSNIYGRIRIRNRQEEPEFNIIKAEYVNNNFNIYIKDPMRCEADVVSNIIKGYAFVKYIIEYSHSKSNNIPENDEMQFRYLVDWVENHRFLEAWDIGREGKGRNIRIDPFFGS
jgi:hypothetical protein